MKHLGHRRQQLFKDAPGAEVDFGCDLHTGGADRNVLPGSATPGG